MMKTNVSQRETDFILRLWVLDFPGTAYELTQLLGVAPTRAHTKGELRLPGEHFKRNSWRKDVVSRGSLVLSPHVVRFLDALAPLPDRLKALVGRCEVALSCHINDYGNGYVVYCDQVLVRRLAEMNVSLEIVIHDGINDPETTLEGTIDLGFLPEE